LRKIVKKLVVNAVCWLLIAYMLSIAISSYSGVFIFDLSFLSYDILVLIGILLTAYYCIKDLEAEARSLRKKLEKAVKNRKIFAITAILLISLSFSPVYAEHGRFPDHSVSFLLENDMGDMMLGDCIVSGRSISCPLENAKITRIASLNELICIMDPKGCVEANCTAGEFVYKWAKTGDENYLDIALNILSIKYLDLMGRNSANMYYRFTLPFVALILAFFLAYFWRLLRGEPP